MIVVFVVVEFCCRRGYGVFVVAIFFVVFGFVVVVVVGFCGLSDM